MAMDSIKSDKSRLESLRAQTQNQEKSMRRLEALNHSSISKEEHRTFFQNLCENKIPPVIRCSSLVKE